MDYANAHFILVLWVKYLNAFLQAVNPSTPYLCCAAGKQNQRIRRDKHVMPQGAQRRLSRTVPWGLGCGF